MLPDGHMFVGGIVSSVIAVIGTLLSLYTIVIFLRSKKQRSNPTIVLILFVLVTNILFTSLVLPINSLALLRHDFMAEHGYFCSIFAIFYFWICGSSLFVQAALAVNRWALVCTHKFKFTRRTSVVAGALGCSVSAFILLIPVFVNGWQEFGYNQRSGTCTSLIHPDRTILFSVCILVPYFFIIICYSRIIYHVKRAKRNIKSNQKWRNSVDVSVIETQQSLDWHYLQNITRQEEEDNREIHMTLIIISILIMYFICTFPAAIIVQLDPHAENAPKVHIPMYILNWLSGIIVPILYGLMNTSYQRIAKFNLCKCC